MTWYVGLRGELEGGGMTVVAHCPLFPTREYGSDRLYCTRFQVQQGLVQISGKE
jgi:hypothetical protein